MKQQGNKSKHAHKITDATTSMRASLDL